MEGFKIIFLLIHAFCTLRTVKYEIGSFMAKAYKPINSLFKDPTDENLKVV